MPVPYHRPSYRVTLAGQDITPKLNGRLTSLRIKAQRDQESDQLDITLTDHDGELAIPPSGAMLSVAIGWKDEGLIDRGTYHVDEVEHSGSPDKLTIRARAADMGEQLPKKRTQSWHDPTQKLGDIIGAIAGRNGLSPVIGGELASIPLPHIDQTDESDINFLTRLGKRYDAVATIKSGRLLFTPAGDGKAASGASLGGLTITRKDGDRHRYSRTSRDAESYTGVKAFWNDPRKAKRQEVVAGGTEKLKELRAVFATEADAMDEARSEWQRIQRREALFELTMAHGRADLIAESPLTLVGWKPQIDGTDWLITDVEDILDDNGYITRIRCEVKAG
ncbi:contractile injection system protein, VgrG/Pvc8 family [Halomonas elongata]|uniref:contractile injection system protein, VgrG/Pvc8 family n=1 Tax=Halomonas elongata TaxID=2746 RepID=UPI0023B14D1B|nr:contractile injection system protein, VgrG/Pvc8 family [Halomonas elongata]